MPPIIKLIQAIARLTQAGAIKTLEDAYKLAKRELGERFGKYKEIIKDSFNEGKRKLTIDKRTKDIKKDEEAGIKSLDVKDAGTDKDFIDFVREQGDEAGANKLQKEVDRLNKIIEDAEKGQKSIITDDKTKGVDTTVGDEIFELSDDDPMGDLEKIVRGEKPKSKSTFEKEKEQLQDALTKLTKEKSLGTMSQEAMIRSAVREFLSRRLKDGTLTIPDAGDRDAIERFTQGVDPIDVFRKAYGEDAIKGVSEIQDEFGDQLQTAGSFNELGDMFEKLFYRESQGGLMYNTKPKPVKDYGFDEGLMSLEEAERMLRKDLKEKEMLEDFDVTDREPNAAGGLAGILKL